MSEPQQAAPTRGPWPVAAWTMVGALALAGGVGIGAGIFSPSLVLDLVSLWPVAVLTLVGLAVALPLRRRRPRLLALPPLLILSWLVLGVGAHLAGWAPLPSSQAVVTGARPEGLVAASLSISLPGGEIAVVPGTDGAAYRIAPLRRGGPVGAPEAVERTTGDHVEVVVEERSVNRWYRFAGWQLRLSPALTWTLELHGAAVDADLTGLPVAGLVVSGSGTVRLGAPTGSPQVTVDGPLVIELPANAAAEVTGTAHVPLGWEATDGGSRSPGGGTGWKITVRGEDVPTIRAP